LEDAPPPPRFIKDLLADIIEAGKGVIAARHLYPDRLLADQYQSLGMARELVSAHDGLDRVVDKAFEIGRTRIDEAARQTVLFDRYLEMTTTANETLGTGLTPFRAADDVSDAASRSSSACAGAHLRLTDPEPAGQRHKREHPAADLDHRDLLTERVCLLGPRQIEAYRQDLVASHGPSVVFPPRQSAW
jgi:hypothetical protein